MPTCGFVCGIPQVVVVTCPNVEVESSNDHHSRTSYHCFQAFASGKDHSEPGCGIFARRTLSPRSEASSICTKRWSVSMSTLVAGIGWDLSLTCRSFPPHALSAQHPVWHDESDGVRCGTSPRPFETVQRWVHNLGVDALWRTCVVKGIATRESVLFRHTHESDTVRLARVSSHKTPMSVDQPINISCR